MDKRKLNGAVDESSVEQHIRKSNTIVHLCENSGVLHLTEPHLTASRQPGWQAG